MKKIGLVTCFINNYGACLQAYALQTVIVRLGHECEIINYVEPASYDRHKDIRSRILKNSITRSILSLVSGRYKKQMLSRKKFDDFRQRYLNLSNQEFTSVSQLEKYAQSYDSYVCGSDQIWNPLFCGKYYGAYMLGFVKDKPKIAYAPSIGLNDIPVEWREVFIRNASSFKYLTCREETGAKIIEKYTKKNTEPVLDPTLLLAGNAWKSILANNLLVNQKYVFCYLFDDREFYKQIIDDICVRLDAIPVIIPFTKVHESWGYRMVYDAGPLDFVSLINFASFVVTDSFHATAFSLNLNTPFYALVRNLKNGKMDMMSRIKDILSLCKLEDRIIIDDNYHSQDLILDIDFANSNRLLDCKRKVNIDGLSKAIGN